jgi:AraC-like DNA-binding protein
MNKFDHSYESHLAVREFCLSPGRECQPAPLGWSVFHVKSGSGYWLPAQSSVELETGSLLIAAAGQGQIRVSQLNGLSILAFSVMPARLTGLITLDEQEIINRSALQRELASRVLPPEHPLAVKLGELLTRQQPSALSFRLSLLQLFVELFGLELEQIAHSSDELPDAKERLRAFLKENPPDTLLEISIAELARKTHCTPRHLSRLFYELVGMSFREKRAEIRLARARELLATSNSKVVEVALESGYKSLSLFNLMFTRRFGLSPGRWRQRNGAADRKTKSYRQPPGRSFSIPAKSHN